MTLALDLRFITTKPYTKFQLNKSKHVGEMCGKLCIVNILSSKRGITQTTSILRELLKQYMSPTGPNKFQRGITPLENGQLELHVQLNLICNNLYLIHMPSFIQMRQANRGLTKGRTHVNLHQMLKK